MHRTNTPAQVANTGLVKIDAGEGVALQVPVAPAADATWATLPGKPTSFPSTIPDVQGLTARLAALEYDSGWRDVSDLLTDGLAKSANLGRCSIKRARGRLLVDMNLTVSADGITNMMSFPAGFRPDVPTIIPFTYWTATTADTALPKADAAGYVGAGGVQLRTALLPNPGTVTIYLDLPISGPLPTTLPGTPA